MELQSLKVDHVVATRTQEEKTLAKYKAAVAVRLKAVGALRETVETLDGLMTGLEADNPELQCRTVPSAKNELLGTLHASGLLKKRILQVRRFLCTRLSLTVVCRMTMLTRSP